MFKTPQITVTTSGTVVQGADDTVVSGIPVTIKAWDTNTGNICLGNSAANALHSSGACFRLSSGQSVALAIPNTNALFFDSTVSGEGVDIIYEKT